MVPIYMVSSTTTPKGNQMSDPILITLVAAVTAIIVTIILKPRKALTFSEINMGTHCECKSCMLADKCSKFTGK